MDFARLSDESMESENPSGKCCSKLEPEPEIVELRGPGSIASLEPTTPDADRECGDFLTESKSPLTQVLDHIVIPLNSLESGDRNEEDLCEGFDSVCSPRTPKDGVFDPFSPGPANLALAPLSRKYFSGSVGVVARRLQFGSSTQLVDVDEELVSDNELLEAVYENLLEVIISNQAGDVDVDGDEEDALVELSLSNSPCDSSDWKTPPAPYLSGVAETCPGAPVKSSRKLRNFDLGLCRKLEF